MGVGGYGNVLATDVELEIAASAPARGQEFSIGFNERRQRAFGGEFFG